MDTSQILDAVQAVGIIIVGILVFIQNRNITLQKGIIADFKIYQDSFSVTKIKEATEHILKGDMEKEKFEFKTKTEGSLKEMEGNLSFIITEHSTMLCKYFTQVERRDYVEQKVAPFKDRYFEFFNNYESTYEKQEDKSVNAQLQRDYEQLTKDLKTQSAKIQGMTNQIKGKIIPRA